MLLTLESGCIDSSSGPINEARPEEAIDDQESSFNDIVETAPEKTFSVKNNTLEKQSFFSGYYSKENLQFEPAVPAYSLPLKASEIANYDEFTQKIFFTKESKDLLYKNGFVVLDNEDDSEGPKNQLISGQTLVNETYRSLKVADVPIFITSDSLLHLYHIQFDETLKRVEAEEFYDELWKLDKALFEASIEDYN
ncbi:MAG: DUF3160 domain-containing protein, partial [Methanosarcina mazei]|nr:DUF3160 domain-containing protein [Methanosarcina mazei]